MGLPVSLTRGKGRVSKAAEQEAKEKMRRGWSGLTSLLCQSPEQPFSFFPSPAAALSPSKPCSALPLLVEMQQLDLKPTKINSPFAGPVEVCSSTYPLLNLATLLSKEENPTSFALAQQQNKNNKIKVAERLNYCASDYEMQPSKLHPPLQETLEIKRLVTSDLCSQETEDRGESPTENTFLKGKNLRRQLYQSGALNGDSDMSTSSVETAHVGQAVRS